MKKKRRVIITVRFQRLNRKFKPLKRTNCIRNYPSFFSVGPDLYIQAYGEQVLYLCVRTTQLYAMYDKAMINPTHSKLLNHSCTHLHKATPKNAQIRPAYGTAGSRVKQKTVNLLMSQSLLWAKSSLRTSCTYMKNLHKLYLIISCICNKRLQMVNL